MSKAEELIGAEYDYRDCRRYVKRLRREKGHLFTFLEHDVDYHNNISERGLRPFAASRKILYGNRSERGGGRKDEDPDERVRDVQDARGQLLLVYQGLPGRKSDGDSGRSQGGPRCRSRLIRGQRGGHMDTF